jgi:hypothetical protein
VSSRPALHSDASRTRGRILVVDDETQHEVFEVVDIAGDVIRARSALLFEVGEELSVRIEHGGSVRHATARVRAHTGPEDARVTELEISDRAAPRGRV